MAGSTGAKRGLFVTFEGLDGSGKSTQLRLLAERLAAEGQRVVTTVEPGGTRAGQAIRRILLDPANHNLSATTELLLYFAARAQNVAEVVLPALASGAIVLCDRFTDSTRAYQGAARGIADEIVLQVDRIACQGLVPDLTLLIDLPVEEARRRALSRNDGDSKLQQEARLDLESVEFHRRVAEGFSKLAAEQPQRIVRIDGRGPSGDVGARVLDAFARFRAGVDNV